MREGLRSSAKLSAESEKNKVSPSKEMVKKEVGGLKQKDCDSTDEDSPASTQKEVSKEEMEVDRVKRIKIEECEGGSDIDECNVVEGSNYKRKGSRPGGEGESGDGTADKNRVKEVVDGEKEVVVRVLRSRSVTKTESGKEFKSRGSDGAEKKWVVVKMGECDGADGENTGKSVDEVREKLKHKHGSSRTGQKSDDPENRLVEVKKEDWNPSDHEARGKLKRKRGRPPKFQKSDGSEKNVVEMEKEGSDLSADGQNEQSEEEVREKLKPKRGRPPKVQERDGSEKNGVEMEKEESDLSAGRENEQSDNKAREKLKPKRGRPTFKAQESDRYEKKSVKAVEEEASGSSAEESDESYCRVRKKLKLKHGRPSKMNRGVKAGGLREKCQRGMKSRFDVNHNVGSGIAFSGKKAAGKGSNGALDGNTKCSNDEKEEGRSKQKKAVVRDKIIEQLLGAGWTIEYRPRNGRPYQDAVYVNPEGRTHWSITLAYRVLKQHYTDDGGDSKTCRPGFKFTPLPDEELSMLTKVMGKERSDKNKKKKKWKQGKDGKTGGGVAKNKNKEGKLNKRKRGALATPGHKLKSRTKLKSSLCNHDDSAGTSDCETEVKDNKRVKTHNSKRCALMIRKSKEGADADSDGYVLYNGKLTVLSWMIDLGTVPLDGKVQYLKRRKTRTVLKGKITMDGIQCDCCGKTFEISDFEAHAGSKSCQPFKNICLETGPSLLQCQLESWHKQDESARKGFHFVDTDGQDPNDDTCGICGDGGDLICCDSCPSTFHQSCLEIKKFPSGVWHCTYCLCKFCGMVGRDTCQTDANDAAATEPALRTCCLCEEKYHHSCIPAEDTTNDDHSSPSFCGKKCRELYDKLQMLLGVKKELEEGFSWTLVRRFDVGSDISLSGMSRKVECNSKVAVASHIMDECFLPMPDHRSRVNLIRNIVYNFGSNFNRLDYSSFLTAILERGDEIVCAASIRIHGNLLAEMPFIGTRHMYRRQGMCRRLLSAIETALCSLNVEKLVLPAISELRETWTSVFGFQLLEGLSKQKMRNMKMVVFPGVDMLQKPLLKHQPAEENMVPADGLTSSELEEHCTMNGISSNSAERCSVGFDLKGPSETFVPHAGRITDKAAAVDAGSLLPDCLNEPSDITSENVDPPVCPQEKSVDQLSVVPVNFEGGENILNPLDPLCDAQEQAQEVTEHQNAVSDSIAPTDDERKLEADMQLNQHNVSEVENNLSGASYIESEAAESGGQCICAPKEGSETVACEVKVEDSNYKQDLNSLHDDSVHTTPESITTQTQELFFQRGFKVSAMNSVDCNPTTNNISCDLVQSTTMTPSQKTQDAVKGVCGVLSVDLNISSSCQGSEPDGLEMEVDHTAVDPTSVHSCMANSCNAAKPDPQGWTNNGLCIATQTELTTGCCGIGVDGVHDLKGTTITCQSGVPLDGGLLSDRLKVSTRSSDCSGSDSEVVPASLTQCNPEPLCSSSSATGVTLLCAAAGCNSCGAPEMLILSNQAS